MKYKTVRLLELEYTKIRNLQHLVVRLGSNAVKCANCGWQPQKMSMTLGGTASIGADYLTHLLENPDCLEHFTKL